MSSEHLDVDPWIQTIGGHAFDLIDMTDNVFDPDEIAVVLSREPRFTAHTQWPYSVAQHSVLVARRFTSTPRRLAGLLHDVPEVVTNDISSPVKCLLKRAGERELSDLQDRIACWIAREHDFPVELFDEVKQADLEALATEKRDLTGPEPRPWCPLPEPWSERIEPWHPDYARDAWLAEYSQLTEVKHGN